MNSLAQFPASAAVSATQDRTGQITIPTIQDVIIAVGELPAEGFPLIGKPGGMRAWDLAFRCLCAGESDRALQWLEKAYEDRDANMPYIGMPIYDSLRPDPRFQDLLCRMNLPQ